jgi:hypothetical protein
VILALAILAAAANAVLTLWNPRLGILVYAGLSMVLPHPSIAGVAVPYEMLGLPAILLSAGLVRRAVRHPRFHILVAAYLALVLLSTLIGVLLHGSALSLIRVVGFLRILVLFSLFRETIDGPGIEVVLLIVLLLEAAVGFAQLVIPGGATLFSSLYAREGGAVLQRYAEMGSIPRASGTFSSPVILGSVALVAVAMAWSRLLGGEGQRRHRWLLLAAGITGILSITKTFLLGFPLVIAGGFIIRAVSAPGPFRFRPRRVMLAFILVLGAIGLGVWTVAYLDAQGLPVGYYLSFLADPTAAFGRRYGVGGQLADAVSVIDENLLIGVGLTTVRDEFLGDSLYVIMLHSTGLVGAVMATGVMSLIASRLVAAGRPLGLLVLLAFLLVGLGANLAFKLPGALALAYLAAIPEEGPTAGAEPRSAPRSKTRSRRAAANRVRLIDGREPIRCWPARKAPAPSAGRRFGPESIGGRPRR